MHKSLRLLLFAGTLGLSINQVNAQCQPDSSILDSTLLVLPIPAATGAPTTLPLACLTETYNLTVTISVPDTFTLQMVTAALDRVEVPTTGGLLNLPSGLSYTCNPPNCVFQENTLGCIQITGVPGGTPQIYDLGISLRIFPAGFPFPIDVQFPGTIAPGQHYYLDVRPAGQCMSGTNDLNEQISSIKSIPNPFGQQTTIQVEALEAGRYAFEVFNVLGNLVHTEQVQLVSGPNSFMFDAGDMPNGAYYFSLSSAQGRVTRTFVVQR
jgi:Secretion system C-terminal sorting domain